METEAREETAQETCDQTQGAPHPSTSREDSSQDFDRAFPQKKEGWRTPTEATVKYLVEIIGWLFLAALIVWGSQGCAGVQLPKRAQVSVGKQTKCPDVKVYVVTGTVGI